MSQFLVAGLWTTNESCSETGQAQQPNKSTVAKTALNDIPDACHSSATWSSKIDDIDIDPSVMDELPPEIHEEVQAWSSEELNQIQLPKETMATETELNNGRYSSCRDAERRETWDYKIDDINPSVMDELPPEIREELQAWSSEELNQVQLPKATMATETELNNGGYSSGGDPERREAWNYKIDDIDPSVMDELPPEIRAEVQAWLRPQKQAKTGKRGSTIAHYFSPMRNK